MRPRTLTIRVKPTAAWWNAFDGTWLTLGTSKHGSGFSLQLVAFFLANRVATHEAEHSRSSGVGLGFIVMLLVVTSKRLFVKVVATYFGESSD